MEAETCESCIARLGHIHHDMLGRSRRRKGILSLVDLGGLSLLADN
jgi:hypothetical protein